jgi:ABC-2 type transport system ATP-binding protein
MIAITDLSVRFGKTQALDGVSLEIPRGQCLLLAGANGSGKTTLLRTLAGVLFPDRGRITLDGGSLWPRQRHRLAYISAAQSAYDGLRLDQAIALHGSFYPEFCYDDIEGYRFDRQRRVGALSRGEKTLFLLTLALATQPAFLLLDDLLHLLDPHLRDIFLRHMVGLLGEQRISLVLASQSAAEVEGILERVVVLAAGRVVLNELVEDLKRRFVRLRLAEVPSGLPVIYAAPLAGLQEIYVYPYTPQPQWQDQVEYLTLPEILRAMIGGRYDQA